MCKDADNSKSITEEVAEVTVPSGGTMNPGHGLPLLKTPGLSDHNLIRW